MATQKNQVPNNPENAKQTAMQQTFYAEVNYHGPLPHPGHLAAYEKIYPGAAKIIFDMAQSQTTHRQALEKKVISSNIGSEKLGTWLTFIALMVIVSFGFLLIYNNKNIPVGIITILMPVLAAGANFYFRKKKEPDELKKEIGRSSLKKNSSPNQALPIPTQNDPTVRNHILYDLRRDKKLSFQDR